MPPRELSAAKCSREYAEGYFAAWRQERRDSPYYNRAQTERYKRGYDQAEMEGALASVPAPKPLPAWLSSEPLFKESESALANTVIGWGFLLALILIVVLVNLT